MMRSRPNAKIDKDNTRRLFRQEQHSVVFLLLNLKLGSKSLWPQSEILRFPGLTSMVECWVINEMYEQQLNRSFHIPFWKTTSPWPFLRLKLLNQGFDVSTRLEHATGCAWWPMLAIRKNISLSAGKGNFAVAPHYKEVCARHYAFRLDFLNLT